MIIRLFKARIRPGCSDAWREKVQAFSIPWLESQHGLLAYYPGQPISEDESEFSMTSVWVDMDALIAAVGENWQESVLLEDEARLVEECGVEHYEVFGS